jgi:hypothetical protein
MTPHYRGEARTLLAQLVRQRHWTVSQFCGQFDATGRTLGLKITFGDRQAKRWMSGAITSMPYPPACRVLEEMFHLPARRLLTPFGYRESQSTAMPLQPAVPCEADGQRAEEVGPSRRRDLLGTGIAVAVGAPGGDATSRAAQLSRAIATSTPDPLSIAQLHRGVQRLAQIYPVTPRAQLVGPVEEAWDIAEARLETRVSGSLRRELELLAGQYAFYRGHLAFDMGNDDTALTFFVLASQHAEAAGDPLLTGSIMVMRSAVAFFQGTFDAAAGIATHALSGAHPYVAPLLAGAAARALALRGDPDGALDAVRTMRDHVWTGPPLPGPEPGDEEFCEAFSAVVLGYLGRGDEAECHARNSLTMLDQTGRFVQTAGSHLALARAFLRRRAPDPEQTAAAAQQAIHAVADKEDGRTIDRAAGIWRQLAATADWTKLPAVRELGEQVTASRRALLPGTTLI